MIDTLSGRVRTSLALVLAFSTAAVPNVRVQPERVFIASQASDTIRFLVQPPDSAQPPRAVNAADVPALQRLIPLNLAGVGRDRALSEIGRAAGLNIIYASDLVPRGATITLSDRAMPVAAAIRTALSGLSVDVLLAEHGLVVLVSRAAAPVGAVEGVVLDSVRGTPVPLAAVRDARTGRTVLTDDNGRFRVPATPGPITLDVRRAGFRPTSIRLDSAPGAMIATAYLIPDALPLEPVLVAARTAATSMAAVSDTFAIRVMRRAIEHALQAGRDLHDYTYGAHVLLTEYARNAPDSALVRGLRESVIEGYWDASGRAQQTIVAERSGGTSGGVTITYPESHLLVEDLGRDTWSVFSVPAEGIPSPIGRHALEAYRFTTLDTVVVDGHRAFRLAITGRASSTTTFDGIVDVLDSTFAIASLDLGVKLPRGPLTMNALHVQVGYADVGGGHWLPRHIAASIDGRLFGVLTWTGDYRAEMTDYRVNTGHRPAGVGEYAVVLTSGAEAAPPDAFRRAPSIPAAAADLAVRAALDSGQVPPRWNMHTAGSTSGVNISGSPNFNRVDGWQLSAQSTFTTSRTAGLTPSLRAGYAFGSRHTFYDLSARDMLWARQRLSVTASVRDSTRMNPGFASEPYETWLSALVLGNGVDHQRYFRERGVSGGVSVRAASHTQLTVGYSMLRQSSMPAISRYATAGTGLAGLRPFPNPSITDGLLHALDATLELDSRALVLEPHRYAIYERTTVGAAPPETYSLARFTTERAAPGTFGGDFDYRRYQLRVERNNQRSPLGSTTFTAVAGTAAGTLPAQRLFEIDSGDPIPSSPVPFATLDRSVYGGDRAAAMMLDHTLNANGGPHRLPWLPLNVSLQAGVFWSELSANAAPLAVTRGVLTAPTPYTEVAATISRWLGLPVIPLSVTLRVARQLSNYPTSRTRFTLGLGGF